MPSSAGIKLVSPPSLNIPPSDSTVNVSIIDSSARLSNLETKLFLEPEITGHKYLNIPAYSFLIENEAKGDKILFDLGVRKDWGNLAKRVVDIISKHAWSVSVPTSISTILSSSSSTNVPLSSISTIIWSHHHWDHTGDPSLFPHTTRLLVGPGFKSAFLPGYPTSPSSPITTDAYANRSLDEVSFNQGLHLGRFPAVDYFGDGSFYLLDSPGHAVGHLCGLARTTPDTFILMAGDACHHGGEFRPTEYLPLPAEVAPSPYERFAAARAGGAACPGHLFVDVHPEKSATEPFYKPASGGVGVAHDVEKCRESIRRLEEFDACENVWVVMAHDEHLLDIVDFWPEQANAWKKKGWRESSLWRFLADFETDGGGGAG